MANESILLKWDENAERLYETGIRRGVLYPWDDSAGWYGEGVPWNGLTSITESPSGAESNPIYADDRKYLDIRSAEEFGLTIEAYTYPEAWLQCDGSSELNGIKGITIGQQPRKKFALCYRSIIGNDAKYNDYGYKLHIVYGCSASTSERQYQSVNDSPEAIQFSWEITTEPETVDANTTTSIVTIDSTKLDSGKAAKLKELEFILYGKHPGSGTDVKAKLPKISEINDLFKA